MALSKQDHVEGMMLVYRKSIVQLRGSIEAAKTLLDILDFKRVEIQGAMEHKDLILDRYSNVKKTFELFLMTLTKGEEKFWVGHPIVELSVADAQDIAALMRRTNPEWWGETTPERIAERMNERLWLGMKIDGKLVSIGGATIDCWGSNIGTVATDESCRNRGFATSIVSALVEKILQKSNIALIHVESDNQPAMRVYTKVGFKHYKRYFMARAEK